MKLENQVTSLELSKRLKDLEVKQESLWWWYWNDYREGGKEGWDDSGLIYTGGKFIDGSDEAKIRLGEEDFSEDDQRLHDHNVARSNYISAFTVAELGEMMPKGFASYFRKRLNNWQCIAPYAEPEVPHTHSVTEANARAKMAIYLLENKLI